MTRQINFKGNPLTLMGRRMSIGIPAPDFRVVTQDLSEARLSDFKNKIKVISSFPSLDTPVCDLQVKEFNAKASQASSDTMILGISKDLPFAQKRFCDNHDIKNELVLSDYKFSSYGINYGLLIKELNLLARSVIIVDKGDVIRYVQIAPELTQPLDYEDVLKNLEIVKKNPNLTIKEDLILKCLPCEGKTPPLPKDSIERLIAECHTWELVDDKKIVKEFEFSNFAEAKYFLDLVSVIAEEQGHHPTMTIIYNHLKITLTTHASGGLTENDFIMAKIIDDLRLE